MEEDVGAFDAAVTAVICEFAAAHMCAKINTKLMSSPDAGRHEEACAERMERVICAENAVLDFGRLPDLPPEVQEFLDAENDPGCLTCWLSSAPREDKHQECCAKIDRWFAARAALVDLGVALGRNRSS